MEFPEGSSPVFIYTKLSEQVGITIANISNLKTGKARGIRFETPDKICKVLECQPADILEYRED